jgi:hypothetical protein
MVIANLLNGTAIFRVGLRSLEDEMFQVGSTFPRAMAFCSSSG